MENAVNTGKVRAIGLSNFDGDRLDDILTNATIQPAVMQVELHPYFQQQALKAKLAAVGTKFESWYPLGHGDAALLNEPVLVELGHKYDKSTAQIVLRWHVQSGHIVFPKTTNPQHMQDNLDIFDFELTADDMAKIDALDKNQRYFEMTLDQQKAQFESWTPAD